MPSDSLRIELSWREPEADLDVHLLSPFGNEYPWGGPGWFNTSNDCYFVNRGGDWGSPGAAGDPRLDKDALFGPGLETIRIATESQGVYRVGVHYMCDRAGKIGDARVRIFCAGNLAFDRALTMPQSGAFWEVATLDPAGCDVHELGLLVQTRRFCATP